MMKQKGGIVPGSGISPEIAELATYRPGETLIGPGNQIIYAAPQVRMDDKNKPFNETAWSFAGAIADHDISLQRLDPKIQLWIATDRVFPGERYRLAYVKPGASLDESPAQSRNQYEQDKKEVENFVRYPTPRDLKTVAIALFVMTIGVIVMMAMAVIGGMK